MFAEQLFTTVLAFLAVVVQASPTPLSPRAAIAPKITNPKPGSVWPIGTVQTVTWDTSNFPPDSQISNPIGKVILGFNESNSLNLDLEHPLAQNFKLRDGSVDITVPNLPPRTDYLIVLMGDSGNTSPQFAITGSTSTDTPPTSTDSTTAPLSTSTTPSSSTLNSAASSSTSSAASTSGALSLYAPQRSSFKSLSLFVASMTMLIMV